jgi:hypothetical protein
MLPPEQLRPSAIDPRIQASMQSLMQQQALPDAQGDVMKFDKMVSASDLKTGFWKSASKKNILRWALFSLAREFGVQPSIRSEIRRQRPAHSIDLQARMGGPYGHSNPSAGRNSGANRGRGIGDCRVDSGGPDED